MKKYKYFTICIICLLFIALYFIFYSFPLVRFYGKTPNFEADAQWDCSNPKITLNSDNKGNIEGFYITKNKKVSFEFLVRNNFVNFYIPSTEEILLMGEYALSKNGDIIIKNISYANNIFEPSNIKQLIFQKAK